MKDRGILHKEGNVPVLSGDIFLEGALPVLHGGIRTCPEDITECPFGGICLYGMSEICGSLRDANGVPFTLDRKDAHPFLLLAGGIVAERNGGGKDVRFPVGHAVKIKGYPVGIGHAGVSQGKEIERIRPCVRCKVDAARNHFITVIPDKFQEISL